MPSTQKLLELDRQRVWHPYAPMPGTHPPLVVAEASGVRLRLADGAELIDGMSSWWAALHGYAHPALDAAAAEQLGRMSGMHRMRDGVLPRQLFAGLPPAGFAAGLDARYADELRELIGRHSGELAAVIVEPVVQGAGGMRFHDPGYLRVLREACDSHGVLLVFDEIATGFGRTGALFAAEHAGVAPDVMCVGKALTGGYLSLAATLASGEVVAGIAAGELPVLAHGPTFMGNPLACAVANASLDVLLGGAGAPATTATTTTATATTATTYPDGWRAAVTRIGAGLRDGLAPAAGRAGVADVRVLGAIGVVQLDHEVDVAAATAAAVGAGVWLRPFRDLVYTMPPYVTPGEDVASICAGVLAAVEAVASS